MPKTELYGQWLNGRVVIADDPRNPVCQYFYFVDSTSATNGDTQGYGDNPDRPFATVGAALTKIGTTFDNPPAATIYLMPGHNEILSTAGAIALNTHSTRLVGIGKGFQRPMFTFDNVNATILVTTENVSIENVRFYCDIDSLVMGATISAAGFRLLNCEFTQNAGKEALVWLETTADADDMIIRGNVFRQATADGTSCIDLIGADRCIIEDNYFYGDWSTSIINGITTASLEYMIRNNTVIQLNEDALFVDMVANSTGRVQFNNGTVVSNAGLTDANVIDAATGQLAENYFSDVLGETGKLIGTVSN